MSVSVTSYRSPLHEMACTTPTAYWNDSCSPRELRYALEHGAVGATSNPVIVGTVLQQDLAHWREPVRGLVAELAQATEDELAWRVCEQVTLHGARLLEEIFARGGGQDGRMSIQTDPRCYRDAERMVAQAVHFAGLAPNLIVKLPVTAAGSDGDRGGHLPRHQHQRDGLLFRGPGGAGGGGGGTRPAAAGGGGQTGGGHGADRHHHGGAAG